MWKTVLTILTIMVLVSACATPRFTHQEYMDKAPFKYGTPTNEQLVDMPGIDGPILTVAVYNFIDKTGQRKPAKNFSQLSTAVSQGPEVWLIQALKEAGDGAWFKVIERGNLDAVIKERQLIRSTREAYEGKEANANSLKPLLFAGLIIEGGIVSYDTNVDTGGNGARYFGIGTSTEYRVDQVTVAMRVISVQTGEVLIASSGTKTIASLKEGMDVFRFLDMGTRAIEIESGVAMNEPVNYAIRSAIEFCVIDVINQGKDLGLWNIKEDKPNEETIH